MRIGKMTISDADVRMAVIVLLVLGIGIAGLLLSRGGTGTPANAPSQETTNQATANAPVAPATNAPAGATGGTRAGTLRCAPAGKIHDADGYGACCKGLTPDAHAVCVAQLSACATNGVAPRPGQTCCSGLSYIAGKCLPGGTPACSQLGQKASASASATCCSGLVAVGDVCRNPGCGGSGSTAADYQNGCCFPYALSSSGTCTAPACAPIGAAPSASPAGCCAGLHVVGGLCKA